MKRCCVESFRQKTGLALMQRVLCNSPTLPVHLLLQRRQPKTCNITAQDRLFLIVWLLSCVVNIQYRRILKRVAGCNQRAQSGSLNSKHVARLIFSLSPLKSLPMETQRQMIAVKCFLEGEAEGNFIVLTYFMTLSGLSSVPGACLYFHAAIL